MIKAFAIGVLASLVALAAQAQPTRLMVRAQALDAKFIGDDMGGVQITLTDARTGAVLAKGLTRGGTGDTGRIVGTPHVRGTLLSDAGAAGFEAVVDIDAPTLVRADAYGPVGKPDSAIRVSSTLLVTPGRDVLGDGWILTFPGIVIEPTFDASAGSVKIKARVRLMCGCVIEPGGLWNAANYRIEALQMKDREVVARTTLTYAGEPSLFAGELPAAAPGRYRIRLVATDATTPNAGMVEKTLAVPARRP